MLREGDDDPEGSVEVVNVDEERRILLQTKNKIVFRKSEKQKIKKYSHTAFDFALKLKDNISFSHLTKCFFHSYVLGYFITLTHFATTECVTDLDKRK